MILGRYNNWIEADNMFDGEAKAPHIATDSLPSDYTNVSSIENWNKYGPELLGSVVGMKDWKCIQREIRTLADALVSNDYDANWNSLNANEKLIVCNYLLSKVPPAKFAATVPDANTRTKIAIHFDLNNRRARGNWQSGVGRVQILRIYLFGKVGKNNALLTFKDAVADGLLELYEGGVEGTVEDGIEGINDFLLARSGTSYELNGLAARSYPIIDGSSDDLEDVANAMVQIASNGMY
jgi:hypothetical protein